MKDEFGWKFESTKALHEAVVAAALVMTDDEIHEHVKAALIKARRMLSS